VPIPEDLVDFLEGGVSILVGTRDATLRPDASRAVGARVSGDRERITLFLSERTAARALSNLEDNARIAVGFSRPHDHFAIQLKGSVTERRPASDAERVVPERYLAAYVEQLYLVGLPRSITRRIVVWPGVAVTVAVEDLFVQTPGPGAGKRLEDK
jgi:predicted pyridoxine 5'-phosphate oxidase superfamily flavin-nucleotide-binding protein